jgi:type II secretory pathway pseudopilin PulG
MDERAERRRSAFSVMELVVSVAILAILAGTLVPVVSNKLAAARDARRLVDAKRCVDALERHLTDKGRLPDGDAEVGTGGWDTSLDGGFVTALGGYLREPLRDPKNDATYHYRYRHYAAGTSGFTSDFYVLGIMNFETSGYSNQHGYWKGADHDWANDFAYVTGGVSH